MIDYEKVIDTGDAWLLFCFWCKTYQNHMKLYEIAISGHFTSFTVSTFWKQRQQPDRKIDLYHIT